MVIELARFKRFNSRPPATKDALAAFEQASGLKLPEEYLGFLKVTDGGDGFIGRTYVILWRVEELAGMNEAYKVHVYAPELLLFGSDGGGEAYAFDMRQHPWI